MNYTSEELKERKAWIKEMRESGYSRDAYVTRVPRIDR